MKKIVLSAVAILIALPLNAAVLITGFGTSEFTIDGGTTDFPTTSQTATSTTAVGTDTNIIAGTFDAVDIGGFSQIELVASITGANPNSQFIVDLFNTGFTESQTYSGFLISYGAAPSPLILTFVSQTAVFTDIAGFVFTGAGAGAPLNITFDSVSAVPEPTTCALIAGSLMLAITFRRRRIA